MKEDIKQQLREIVSINATQINNNDFESVIKYIIDNYDYKLQLISLFIQQVGKLQIANHIPLSGQFQNIFEDTLDDILCPTHFAPKDTYPTHYWNALLRNEIPHILSFIEQTFNLKRQHSLANQLQNIKIKFTNTRQYKVYGNYSKQDIEKIIDKYVNQNPNLPPHITQSLHKISSLFASNDVPIQYLIEELKNSIKEFKSHLSSKELKGLDNIIATIKQPKFIQEILGTFSHNFTITLHIESIFDHSIKFNVPFTHALLEVFAHELFHAFHFLKVDNIKNWTSISPIILESFASYFEYLFCKDRGIYVFNLERDWQKYDMYTYPYSGARFIKENVFKPTHLYNPNSIKKYYLPTFENCVSFNFAQLFELSLLDQNCALRVFDLFYHYYNI